MPHRDLSRRALLGVFVAVPALGACRAEKQQSSAIDQVEVGGDFGTHPQVSFRAPLTVTETNTREVITGEGTELTEGAPVMVSYLAVDATSGETVVDTFSSQPEVLMLTPDAAGPLYEDLLGRTEGSRLLRVELGTAAKPDPLVLVYDLLHTRARGEPVEPEAGAPVVTLAENGAPTITVPDTPPPTGLDVVQLIRGAGPQVRVGVAVTVRYTAVSWTTGEVVDTTWGEGQAPTTIPFTGLIPGWQDGLVDETVGSQVMLVVPPEQAFGDDTLVYVIDVLAVSTLNGTDGGAG